MSRYLLVFMLALAGFMSASTLAQTNLAARLDRAIKAAGVAIDGISPDPAAPGGWRVSPPHLHAAAQPTIEAFNPNDPAHEQAELDAQVKTALDTEHLTSAVVWTVLKQMYPADTDAQTKTKYGVARRRVIDAFKSEPWK